MAQQIDEATKLLIDSLSENLKELALSAGEIGYLSKMDFDAAILADEIPEEEQAEVLEFFKQDLGLEILDTDNDRFVRDMEKYYEEDDENYNRDKTRDLLNADAEQVDVNDEDYEHYAKQLERSSTGNLVLGIQDSVQSYLKQIGTVQLLTAAGEIAIAQRIEAASRLMVYGLCESPMTIQSMLNWYQQLLNGDIKLRHIINLEVMYSSDSEKKTLAALADTLKSKGVDQIDDLNDEDLDELEESVVGEDEEEDETEDMDEENSDGKKEDSQRSSSGVPIPAMEDALMPMITDLFAKIKRIFTSMQKLQAKRLENLLNSSKPDETLEKKYTKARLELFEYVGKIRLNDDRISEIMEKLNKYNQLLMGLEGKMQRLALSCKIKRDDFLDEYVGNEMNRNWVKRLAKNKSTAWQNFAIKHQSDVLKIQEDITKIAKETGQPTAEYKKVVELVRRGQSEAARAKREMIEANLRLVIKFAKKSSNRGLGLDFSDLVQDGNIGLMKAVDKFDYRLGNKFSTYATNWIQQGISRSIADQARTIRIPVHMIDNIHKIQRASRQFMHKYGRQPTAEELSKMIFLPVDKIHKAMKVNLKPISLEAPVGTEDDSSRIEIIADETAKNPFIAAALKNLRDKVSLVMHYGLDEKEETVLRMRFGMSNNKPCTLEEVGEYLGVTRERVRQIEQKALNKLKHPTRARVLRSFMED